MTNPNLPPDVLADGPRAIQYTRAQPPVGGDWVLSRSSYNRRPHYPTLISPNFSERFSKIQSVPHTKKFVSVWYPTHSLSVGNATFRTCTSIEIRTGKMHMYFVTSVLYEITCIPSNTDEPDTDPNVGLCVPI